MKSSEIWFTNLEREAGQVDWSVFDLLKFKKISYDQDNTTCIIQDKLGRPSSFKICFMKNLKFKGVLEFNNEIVIFISFDLKTS